MDAHTHFPHMSLIMVRCFSSVLHGVLSSSCVLMFGCLVHCISWYNTCAKTFSCSYLQKIYNFLALSLIMFYWALRAFSTLSGIEFRHYAICASVRFSLKYLTWLLLLGFYCSMHSFVHIYCLIVYPIRPLSFHVKKGENDERGSRLPNVLIYLDVEFCLQALDNSFI